MAKRKNTVNYNNIKITDLINNPSLAKKAIAAANARINRMNKSEFADISKEMEHYNKLVFDVKHKIYPTKYSVNMFTKSERFSLSNKGYSQHQLEMKYSEVLKILRNDLYTVPGIKNVISKAAKSFGVSVTQYLSDRLFWKSFRELYESSKYGSDQIYNVVRTLESKQMSYDDIVAAGKQLLEQAQAPIIPAEVKAKGVKFTASEFKNMLNRNVTDQDYMRGSRK